MLLFALATASLGSASLSDLAKKSTQVFALISYAQLTMICLLAPVFTASAITQERDSRTYNILLATPLTNTQIVLGTLMSRMYYVIVLLLSGIPVFAITLFYGGVTGMNIALSFAIALSTGLFMGSLAITIAVFRLGTGKTVFWFYVFNAVYLLGLFLIEWQIAPVGPLPDTRYTTWLTGIHPFLALRSVVQPSTFVTPDLGMVAHLWRPFQLYLLYPAYAYVALTLAGSLLLVGPSAIVLRRIAQRSDVGLWQYLHHLVFPKAEGRTRRARRVWANPVAWREAATRAGVSTRGVARWATVIVGIVAGGALLYCYHKGLASVVELRRWLVILVRIEFSVALLVAANTSASAVTRERESQTLDLLLVTPITSRYYIWGKLRGLVSFMLPFAAVPALTVLVILLYDLIYGHIRTNPIVFPEVVVELPLFLTILIAFACMLGLHLSLKWSRTIVAVMVSVGALILLQTVIGACGLAALKIPVFGLIFAAFSPQEGICVLLDPLSWAPDSFNAEALGLGAGAATSSNGVSLAAGRIIIFISVLASTVVYCLLVWTMYRSMVRNFDMIIRRQHR